MAESRIRVLIVEDDPLAAEAHAAYLGRLEGFVTVANVSTSAAAIRFLRDGPREGPGAEAADLVLLDMNLPDGDGLGLCRSLRSAGVEVDVIAITAVQDAAVVRSAVALGMVNYLIKPFGFSAFAAKLNAYRDFRRRLRLAAVPDQHALDASFAALHGGLSPAAAKGLSPETLDRVRAELAAPGWAERDVSASELAERLGLSRVTARRYLEHLAAAGSLERVARHGAPGRPEVGYRPRR